MGLIIKISDKMFDTFKKHGIMTFDNLDEYDRDMIADAIANGKPYNPTGDCISREVINSEIEKRYCSKHCVVPSEEPYCPDNCPARFLKNIVKECPTVDIKDQIAGAYNEGYMCGSKEAEKARPQGEWIDYDNTFYKCPECGYLLEKDCPQCQNKVILPKGGAE